MGIREMSQLTELKRQGDVNALVEVLLDESRDGTARRFCAAALGELRARKAVEPLVETIDDPIVWEQSMLALVNIGDPVAAAPIVHLMYETTDRLHKKKAEKALKRLHKKNPDEVEDVLAAYEARRQRRQTKKRKRRR
jgi:HEAT repeat protein